ncbi:MAG: cobalamin-dependent protein [Alphaproteobacteria bacterium]|nr:cobalamin-dependent protein [Alphaproteobacteria bacterium]
MVRKRVTVLDLAAKAPARTLYARVLHPNLASIMPQVIAAWCEELGHDVTYVCYTGFEDLDALLARDTDAVFISAFSRAAQTAYAIANLFRLRGAVTILGGPHARAYPEDAVKYFDYVLGFTHKETVDEVLRELAPNSKSGRWLSAASQPSSLPSLAARWKFIAATIAKEPFLKIVPMIGSMGCPYTCSFCIDSVVDYQPLAYDQLREDLRFLLTKRRRPLVGWHDPNFGVRFNDYMNVIEDVVPKGHIRFVAESSLSLLSEPHLKRLKANGFIGMMPGIESWYDHGAKSKTGRSTGLDKVRHVADHINTVLRYIPFVQTNFVLGLDSDQGSESFELTKRFFDLTPGAFPAFNLFTAYGRSAPLNLELQRANRVLPFPFFFLDGNHAMNVKPLNYEWQEFYRHAADVTAYALSGQRVWRRLTANSGIIHRVANLVRGKFSLKRVQFHNRIHDLLSSDPEMRPYFEGASSKLPEFYLTRMRNALGPLWDALPPGAITHDQNAYRKNPTAYQASALQVRQAKRIAV